MSFFRIKPARSIRGEIFLPGDKSIAHRSIIISAIAKGTTNIHNFPTSKDCLTTIKAFKQLGVNISKKLSGRRKVPAYFNLCVIGRGLYGLRSPRGKIDVGESGTTARLILGVLAAQSFSTRLTTKSNLMNRPMRRITKPLRRMGAIIKSRRAYNKSKKTGSPEEYLPISIKGVALRGISYKMPIASAQVKSSLLLAGLYSRGTTKILEPIKTRDHTERILRDFKVNLRIRHKSISVHKQKELVSPTKIFIPGDISSASFFIVAAILLVHSNLVIRSVCLNPTRLGLIRVLKRMGATIKVIPTSSFGREPIGDIFIKSSKLKAARVPRSQIPQVIDELPILMLAACFARGKTIIYGVEELRVKETDRIRSMQANLSKMGADIYVEPYHLSSGIRKEKIVIQGTGRLKGSRVISFDDHRTAMSMVIAGLVSVGNTLIDDITCINKSFPDFLRLLERVVE